MTSKIPILVVDDNPTNQKLLLYLLSAKGFEVQTASDAKSTLAVLQGFHPRIILMDVQLPDVDGLTLTRQLKAAPETRDIAVIAVTAYAMKGDEQRAREAGCDDYISKPIDTRALPERLLRILAKEEDAADDPAGRR